MVFDTSSSIMTSSNYSIGKTDVVKIKDADRILPEKIGKRGVQPPTLSYFGANLPLTAKDDWFSFMQHEYDLYEYSRIVDTEAIVYKAFERKKALMFKNGYEFKSDSDENIAYIRKRLREFKFVSGISFEHYLEELAYSLIIFHNAYSLIYRDKNNSTGEDKAVGNSFIDPISCIFPISTESIERVIDENGEILNYRQRITQAKVRYFNPDDVKHITYNKRSGFTMGTPPLEPVKDDILALRRIEESVETLIYKSLFPIIHVKVGTDSKPATIDRSGLSEVTLMNQVLRDIDDYGGVVTSERVNITSIGAESMALRVESYLNHFLERVMIGLGVSATDLGIGDSTGRATGAIISQNLREAVTDMQRVISRYVTEDIFTELLVESGKYRYKYEIPEEDLVYLSFNEVDRDSQVKIESHLLNLMNSGAITYQELRAKIGLRPMTKEELKSMGEWAEKVTPPSQIDNTKASTEQMRASTKASKAQAQTQASGSSSASISSSSNNKSKKSGAKNLSSSVASPKNQFSDSKKIDEDVLNIINILGDKALVKDYLISLSEQIVDIKNIHDSIIIQNICEQISDSINLVKDNKEESIDNLLSELYISIGESCTI